MTTRKHPGTELSRVVLDSSVLVAAVQRSEPDHQGALDFVERLRAAQAADAVSAFGPPELWLEVYVVEQRLARSRPGSSPGSALLGLRVELVAPRDLEAITDFLGLLSKRMRGRRPFANATDLNYLWAATQVDATVVTLDRGLLGYHGLVCDVTRPEHARLG